MELRLRKLPRRAGRIDSRAAHSRAWPSARTASTGFCSMPRPICARRSKRFPPLAPGPDTSRNSPIAGVLLTNADLDHVLGLFHLREGGPLALACAPRRSAWRSTARSDCQSVLQPFCGVDMARTAARRFRTLLFPDGTPSGLSYRAIPLPGQPPRFAADGDPAEWQPQHRLRNHGRPHRRHACWSRRMSRRSRPELREAMEAAGRGALRRHILVGTTNCSEMRPGGAHRRRDGPSAHLRRQPGMPCAKLPARHKIYMHINNTNPILRRGSPERAQVEKRGNRGRRGRDGV